MKTTSKHTAAFLAALILTGAAFGHYPVRTPVADAKSPSIRDFADSVLPELPEPSDNAFENLCYSKDRQELLCDGKAVSADSISGFRVIDGELCISASETARAGETAKQGYLSLEEAAPLIGLETYETNDGVYVSNPFSSGTLIVKSEHLPDALEASEIGSGWGDLHVLQYPTAADAYAAYQNCQQDDSIIYAEPNRVYHVAESQAASASGYEFPSDNWGWEAIGADEFLTQYKESAASAPQVKVAVIDTGLYNDHDWFHGRIAEGGASFVMENDGSYEDLHGHGTHCAGIICGMTPDNVKILPLKVLNQNGYGNSLNIYCALLYAAEQDADVVNMSLGGTGCSPILEEAARVLTEHDIPCVVAAGNESSDAKYHSPANIPEVITVSSISEIISYPDDYKGELAEDTEENSDAKYELSFFSNFGRGIDFAAPGDQIKSAYIESPACSIQLSGTSMAAPHVTGCVADILTVQNDFTISEVYNCLKYSACDLGDPGFDEQFGWGMVNIAQLDFHASELAPPEASCASGTFDEVFTITLSTTEPDAEIRYTLDGTTPEADTGILYQGGEITIDNTAELVAVTVKNGKRSCCIRRNYVFFKEPPRFSPASGDYYNSLTIVLNGSRSQNVIYTLDGSDPTLENGIRYVKPFRISQSVLFKACYVIGNYISEPCVRYYKIDGQELPEKVQPKVFETEDGVLTHYYGTEEELDLNDYFKPGEITKIGYGVFQNNEKLKSIILPEQVTSIGAYAFAKCKALTEITAPDVTEIGTHCFEWDDLLYTLNMPSLKKVGSGAFYFAFSREGDETMLPEDNQIEELADKAFWGSNLIKAVLPNLKTMGEETFGYCYDLKTVKLSQTITALPYKTFDLCNELVTLDAPGVTELGDYALSIGDIDIPRLKTYTFDFSKLTSIGTEALTCFSTWEMMDRVSFDSLTHLGANAFRYFPAKELCFPSLKNVSPQAFWDATCQTVYLEQAETLEEGALSLNPERGEQITFVFGDCVTKNQKNPLTEADSQIVIAAPDDSPMKQFAQIAGCEFHSAPDICTNGLDSVCRYDMIVLEEHCFPLDSGSGMTFTVLDTEYASGYQAPEKPLFANYSEKNTILDTTVPGVVTLRADRTDASGTVLQSKTLEITIRPDGSEDIVTKEGVVFATWSEDDSFIYITDPEDAFATPLAEGKYEFVFVPEEDGEYYFYPEHIQANFSVYSSRNERIVYAPLDFIPNWVDDDALNMKPVKLKAGEPVHVVAETTWYNKVEDRYISILITQKKPLRSFPEYDLNISMNQSKVQRHDALLLPETEEPDVSSVSVSIPDYYDSESETVLQRGVDYDFIFVPSCNGGTLVVCGMGDYIGQIVIPVIRCPEYKLGETAVLPEIGEKHPAYYRISNVEHSGKYIIGVEYSEAHLKKHASGIMANELYKTWPFMRVYDSEMVSLDSLDEARSMTAESVYMLEAGETYYIYINLLDSEYGVDETFAEAGTFALISRENDEKHWIDKCEPNTNVSLRYSGDQLTFVTSLTAPDGSVLEEGKDYCLYVNNAALPGKKSILLCGIGDYYGSCTLASEIEEPYLESGPFEPQTLTPNQPFTLEKACGCYTLTLDSSYSCKLRQTGSSDPDAEYICLINQYDETTYSWKTLYYIHSAKNDEIPELKPGNYRIYLAQSGEKQTFILDAQKQCTGIAAAEVQAQTMIHTGKELEPVVTLTLDGKVLTNGEDYLLLYPQKPIIGCGAYELTAVGIGEYCGKRTVQITVQQSADSGVPEVQSGDIALDVTEPGHHAVCEWTADKETCGIRLHSIEYVSLTVFDPETNHELLRLEGGGYLCGSFDTVPGKKYRIAAAWYSKNRTGEISFTLLSDYTDLNDCTLDTATQCMFTESGILPEITLRNGDTVLKKDVDYNIYYSGGNTEAGHAEIALTGIGTCIGELTHHCYLAPEMDMQAFEVDESKQVLTLNAAVKSYIPKPGEVQHFEFEAPADGCYGFDRPDPEYAGVCVFAYGPDEELLPLEAASAELKKGDKLRFIAVADRIDDYLNTGGEYHLAVRDSAQDYELHTEDSVYLVQNGAAYLHQYTGENIGIQLPETVQDPESGAEFPVKGCTQELIAALGDSVTFYCEKDSECYAFLTKADCCVAVPEPQTDIRGDITGDGKVNSHDLLTLTRLITECPGMLLNDAAFAAADVNSDGCLDLSDITAAMEITAE